MKKINLGEYDILFNDGNEGPFELRALRHGEDWKDLVGDNLSLMMVMKIEELEEKVSELKKLIGGNQDEN